MQIIKIIIAGLMVSGIHSFSTMAQVFSTCEDSGTASTLSGSTCSVIQLPLEPVGDGEDTVELFVRQFPTLNKNQRRGQVWLIAGGPGESGASLYPFLSVFQSAFPDYDLLVPDHRGTGYSTRLCPEQEAIDSPAGFALDHTEWGPCIGSIYADETRAHAFTITNAAHDLSALIELFREPGEVHVYAVSYGTQLVLRMMQVASVELDSLVLDGLVPPESEPAWDLSHRTNIVDGVGRELLTAEQINRYTQLLEMDSPPWGEVFPGDIRQFMGGLLNFPVLRERIPLIVDSLLEDEMNVLVSTIAKLENEHARLTSSPQSEPSLPLVMLISASENNERRNLTAETVRAEAESALFTSAIPGLLINTPFPLYERDDYFGQNPTSLPRTLVIHGTLDPNTPYAGAKAHAEILSNAGNVKFVSVSGGAHLLPFVAPECFTAVVSGFMAGKPLPEYCEFPEN